MQPLAPALVLFSVLFPTKLWFAPDQPWTVTVRGDTPLTLVLTDFVGKTIEAKSPLVISESDKVVDLKEMWPPITYPGTYLLYAVPKDKRPEEFVGTPLVIEVLADTRRDAPPGAMVMHVRPLCYAVIETDLGSMTVGFYYDVAPHTIDNFIALAEGGFYGGLTFHRIAPNFVVQGGDPRGDGSGGPGYVINEEFNDRKHDAGVLSMSRQTDPMEAAGAMPRAEAANSAGSQFFICLDYSRTEQLDGRYTVFGKVIGEDGMKVLQQLGAAEVDPQTDRPIKPQIIRRITIRPVDAANNPYPALLTVSEGSTTAPTNGK